MFDGVLARGPVASAVADNAWLAACLEVEAALARVEARAGLIRADDADRIVRACRPELFDAVELGTAAAGSGNPVVPLVAALRARVSEERADEGPEGGSLEGGVTDVAGIRARSATSAANAGGADSRRAAAAVHFGATSQDILDTAAMLVVARAIDAALVDLDAAADAAAALADAHRYTIIIGRTLLQHALPTTFGAKAAGWLGGLDAAARRLREVRAERLAVQLGGATGTLAALGEPRGARGQATDIDAILRDFAAVLGLAEPVGPWHAERTRIAELAGALGETAAAIAKPALDLVLLAQGDVGEIADADPDRGTSSTLPQKRNPVAAIAARACAVQAPGLVATLLAVAGAGEHERAAGAWQAEWRPMTELLRSVGSAAAWLRDALEHVMVDAERMRANLHATGGIPLAERVVNALAPLVGHEAATRAVRRAVRRAATDSLGTSRPFVDALLGDSLVAAHLDAARLDELLDPATYLGAAGLFIDRALAAHRLDARGRMKGDASGVRLHRVIDGPPDAPVLVLIHSLGTSLEIWQPQVDRLRDRFRIVRVDIRGHGRSPVVPGPCSIADLARDVLALLDELGVASAHVCGLSIGGMIAMWLAAHAPGRVDRIVLCATSARLGPPERWADRSRRVREVGMTAIVDGVVQHWLTPGYAAEHPELIARLRAMLAATDPVGYVACCGAIETMDLTGDLGLILAPTLIVSGADDLSIPPNHGAAIAAGVRGSRLEVLPNAAHLLNMEQPDLLSTLLAGHLSAAAPEGVA